MATTKRFRAVLEKDTDSSATAIAIPFDVEKAYGSRGRVPVRGTLNGFAFRSSVFPMGGGCHWLVVNRDMREGAKIKAGETISVMMERDDEPRVITPPKDLARALAANKVALAAWDKLSYTHRKEYAKAIEEAKKPETRARRIEKAIAALAAPKS
ncbi:MAG TPA: YdeI/OmpD-associated family protein [Blastocatellia bacterium]|nr:YdeI/OmpD-associated family protein [Blastocatellia bacterium]